MRTATSTTTLMDRYQQQQQQPHLETFLLVCDQHEAKQRLEILLLQGKSLLEALLTSERATSTERAPTRPAAAFKEEEEERLQDIQLLQQRVERHLAELRRLRWRLWHVQTRLSSHRAKQATRPPAEETKRDAFACMTIDLGAHERLLDNIIGLLQDYVRRPDMTTLHALVTLHIVEGKVAAGYQYQ